LLHIICKDIPKPGKKEITDPFHRQYTNAVKDHNENRRLRVKQYAGKGGKTTDHTQSKDRDDSLASQSIDQPVSIYKQPTYMDKSKASPIPVLNL
jgi:CRISPR/Cas system-associated protein Cas10 (large subunit of type III CRISPR-Cas system)